jgi:hypothetical protein
MATCRIDLGPPLGRSIDSTRSLSPWDTLRRYEQEFLPGATESLGCAVRHHDLFVLSVDLSRLKLPSTS